MVGLGLGTIDQLGPVQRAFVDEQPGRRAPDTSGRAGHEADASCQAQIQGRLV